MTPMEEKGLLRGGVLLILLALARVAFSGFQGPPVLTGPTEDQLSGLMEKAQEEREASDRASTPLGSDEKVDPNRAGARELDRLPGVGPSLAETLVRHRETKGGFQTPEDLLAVSGIGPATLERIRAHLDFSRGIPLEVRKTSREASLQVDLNRAGREELESLPGIGPALAGRILESRSRDGPFRTVEDLLRVPGIGPATLERLRSLTRVGR